MTIMKYSLDDGAFPPVRAHETDAGADIRTPVRFKILSHGSAVVCTGIHVQLPPNTVGMLKSKSGLHVRSGITSEGVIDEGYTGEIVVRLENDSDQSYVFERGDKITQLVVMPVMYPTFVEVDKVDGGERGDAGFGSTGR